MPEQTKQYVHLPVRDKGGFQSFVGTITVSAAKGIKAVLGIPKGGGGSKVQKYIFAKANGWTMEKARAWVNRHEHSVDEAVTEHLVAGAWEVLWLNEEDEALDAMQRLEEDLGGREFADPPEDEGGAPTTVLLDSGRLAALAALDSALAEFGLPVERKAEEMAPGGALRVTYELATEGDLGTETVEGVEILATGTHTDRHGKTITISEKDLDALVEAEKELRTRGFRPMVRLTHEADHPLLGGLPSLGWPSNFRTADGRRGGKVLVSDFLAVPKGIAAVVKLGGYDRVSAGIARKVRAGDYSARLAVHHVALLGVKHPAVTSLRGISGIEALYKAEARDHEGGDVVEFEDVFESGDVTAPDEGGTMDKKEALKELGMTEAEFDEQAEKAAKHDKAVEDAKTAKTRAETAETTLEETRETAAKTRAAEFAEGAKDKLTVPNRKRLLAIHAMLSQVDAEEPLEFEFDAGDGKTETVKIEDPVAELEGFVTDVLEHAQDVVEFEEKGEQKHDEPGSKPTKKGKKGDTPVPGSAEDTVELDDGDIEDGGEMEKAAEKRALELLKERHEAGDLEYTEADAFEDALVELSEAEGGDA